ncbi:hypothetical protein BVRB_2g033950 [Beta vulgaris subsp. vulgaris]|nr:hypothetical protein BVRB_2g033950 [Beta vulgaris subsp. vulgaris]
MDTRYMEWLELDSSRARIRRSRSQEPRAKPSSYSNFSSVSRVGLFPFLSRTEPTRLRIVSTR